MPKITFEQSIYGYYYTNKYEKHTAKKIRLNYTEYLGMTVDERKFNLSYWEILKQIEGGKIDPNQLGMKM
jgi:hypothetical protein